MADDLSQFIESLIGKYGLWKVITAPFVLVPILAAFGIQEGTASASLIAAGTAFMISFVVMIALGLQLRKARSLHFDQERTIMRLTETVMAEELAATYTWEDWYNRITVTGNGDALIEEWRTLRVNDGAELRVVWAAQEITRDRLTPAQRRSSKVDAFDFSIADGQRVVGIQYDLARVWHDRDQILRAYVCPNRPLIAGEVMNVMLVWNLPGSYRELLTGARDDVAFRFKRGIPRRIELDVIFDRTCGLRSKMRVQPYAHCPTPEQEFRPNGSLTLHVSYGPGDIPSIAGFVLDNGSLPSATSL